MENKIHYEKFKEFIRETLGLNQGAVGVSPRDFWKYIICDGGITFKGVELDINELSKELLDREDVLKIIENEDKKFIVKIISIFAWGKMKPENAVMFFGYYQQYKDTLEKILNNQERNRKDIYGDILKLNLKNCKPAYFTKLIFFFTATKDKPGYIMDQWTAKSINILTGEYIVKLDDGFVSGRNNKEVYEKFCNIVERLANDFKMNGAQIEQYLFDNGGTNPGNWRAYVKNNYKEISKNLKKPNLPQKKVSKKAKTTKTNEERQIENIQGPLYSKTTTQYLGLYVDSEQKIKVGYIDDKGWLCVSQKLKNFLSAEDWKWEQGNTRGGSREIYKTKFDSKQDCIEYLKNKGVIK